MFPPLLSTLQLQELRSSVETEEGFSVRVCQSDVMAIYERDEVKLCVTARLPPTFPLSPVETVMTENKGIKESR